jgi:hypothetical protein
MFTTSLASLVKDGTISAAQQKAIAAALQSSFGRGMAGGGQPPAQGGQATPAAQPSAGAQPSGGQPPDPDAMFTTALDPLVKKGTITAAQEKAVIAALSQSMPGGAPGQQGGAPAAQTTGA